MKNGLFLLLTVCFLFTTSCGKDEMPIKTPNELAFDKIIGNWKSITHIEDGVDVTSDDAFTTFAYHQDSTFMGTINYGNGYIDEFDGTFLFLEEGLKLNLEYENSGGLAKYDVLELTETTMSLSINLFGTESIAVYERQ